MSIEGLSEPIGKLSAQTMDMHRAITSLMRKLESLDGYNQRFDACTDPELKRIIAHSRDEEKAHASMLLEWIRRRDPTMDHELRTALFKAGPITAQHKDPDN